MSMVLPKVLGENLSESKRLSPVSLSLNENLTPLSYASMQLPKGETIEPRSYVEIYTPNGLSGVFRAKVPQIAYGDDTTSVELEHAITEIADYLVKDVIDEMMDAETAIRKLFGYYGGNKWRLGSISSAIQGEVAVDVDYDTVLEAILSILNQRRNVMMAFDFATTPWTLSIIAKPTEVAVEGRLSRNVSSARVSYSDDDLCTRAYADGLSGTNDNSYGHLDASTIGAYGIIEKQVSVSSDYTENEITNVVESYLNDHSEPKVTITIDGEDLSSITGESLDAFKTGKLCRLAIPDYGIVIERHIISVSWEDLVNTPNLVTVTMGDPEDTFVSYVHDTRDKAKTSAKKGSGLKKKVKKNDKEYWTKFEKTDKAITLEAYHRQEGDNLAYSKIEITASQIRSEVKDSVNSLESSITQTASQIRLEVRNTASSLQSSITQTASQIRSEVSNSINGVNSSITQTASQIRSEVSNSINGVNSSITQTASQIRSEVSNSINGVNSSITQTASQIRSEVSNSINGVNSSITQTASQIRSEVSNSINGVNSSITQTASQIRSEVSNTASGLSSRIEQNSTSIALKVSKGDVATQLAVEAGNVTVKGGNLVVEGYVTSDGLSSAIGDINNLMVQNLGAASIEVEGDLGANEAYFSSLEVNGNAASWKSKNLRYCTLSTERPFMYGSTSGASGTVTGSVVISYTDSTIYYLGR